MSAWHIHCRDVVCQAGFRCTGHFSLLYSVGSADFQRGPCSRKVRTQHQSRRARRRDFRFHWRWRPHHQLKLGARSAFEEYRSNFKIGARPCYGSRHHRSCRRRQSKDLGSTVITRIPGWSQPRLAIAKACLRLIRTLGSPSAPGVFAHRAMPSSARVLTVNHSLPAEPVSPLPL